MNFAFLASNCIIFTNTLLFPQCPQKCANCQTTYTPLWRKDRSTGLVMCNACGIYFKNHGRHRPLELIESSGSGAFGRAAGDEAGPAPPALPPIKAEVRRLTASNSTPSFLLNRRGPHHTMTTFITAQQHCSSAQLLLCSGALKTEL